jgi:alpha-beta hydrolase superfamily lysophospholipase
MGRLRTVNLATPAEVAKRNGLAYSLWLPEAPTAGVVILHGAGSAKESHHDFARAAHALGLAAIAFDQRGHGDSDGPMGSRALEDIAAMAGLLRSKLGSAAAPIALRGSSMGGYLAILAAPQVSAAAIVAICPASADGLRRGLQAGTLRFDADVEAIDAFLAAHDLHDAVEALLAPLLLLHAEGDEQVPVQHSRELAARVGSAGSRLVVLPGGHHRSIQHDEELQAVSLKFIANAVRARSVPPAA